MKFVNSPSYPKRSNYQPGGISAGYDAILQTRLLKQGSDKLGRWTWQDFGQNDMITRVYTLYRVNAGSEHASGMCTAWYQQKMLLDEQGISANSRSHVITDLIKELRPLITKGHNILLFGDFNEGNYSPEGMSTKLSDLGLYNVMEEKLGTTDLPRTHARGSKAIDHIWSTKYLLDNIKLAGMSPFGKYYDSDHRGFFIDIGENVLFNENEKTIAYHDFRRLKSAVPKRVRKHTKILSTEWKKHKIEEKFEKLAEFCAEQRSVDELACEINTLDKQITEIMTNAEKKMYNGIITPFRFLESGTSAGI